MTLRTEDLIKIIEVAPPYYSNGRCASPTVDALVHTAATTLTKLIERNTPFAVETTRESESGTRKKFTESSLTNHQ